MTGSKPIDLLIECEACKIENMITGYTPGQPTICNQCRGRLIEPNLNETHKEYVCSDCAMVLCLLNKTEITTGESVCRCGGKQILKIDEPKLKSEAASAGAFELNDPEGDASEDFDWCRSDPVDATDTYNELFDDDPAQ